MTPSAFLLPPPHRRLVLCKNKSSSLNTNPRRPRHGLNTVTSSLHNPFDGEFTISKEDISISRGGQDIDAFSSFSVSERRQEQKRQEAIKDALERKQSDDEDLRLELVNENVTAADLFGSSQPSPSLFKGSKTASDTPRADSILNVSGELKNGRLAKSNNINKRNRTKKRQPRVSTNEPFSSSLSTDSSRSVVPKSAPVENSTFHDEADKFIRHGDLVSHVRYGVGRFRGLEKTITRGLPDGSTSTAQEYAVVEYRDGDVYVPLSHFDFIRKLSQKECAGISKLDTMCSVAVTISRGSRRGSSYALKKKTRHKIRTQIVNLHGLYAARSQLRRERFPVDLEAEGKFNEMCDFCLTKDQDVAIKQVFRDMSELDQPMDRLLCGDVGFGKTEVALRAAFRALRAGKQVAVLAPTTILAQQHLETFEERIKKSFPEYSTVCFSRFVSRKDVLLAREGLAAGKHSVAVGTTMMLSEKVIFRNLGLLIVDEEHRFGVNQKEKIRSRYRDVDTLFMSATPIPRTLHLSLSGLRDTSVLSTPPPGRKPVITKVTPNGSGVVRHAIRNEIDRGGQVFFVVPRVCGIEDTASWLEELFPDLRVLVAHGSASHLERRIWEFAKHEYDILVCTSIIENGINMPNVNTIIIQDATRFGLAQLHQLRGRVGRSDLQGYAWICYSKESLLSLSDSHKRLKVLEDNSALGAGFAIAQRDMEMRGVGTVLGVQQHGNNSIQPEEYAQMLAEELECARTGKPVPLSLPKTERVEIFLPVVSLIPDDYIESFEEKMHTYSFLSSAGTLKELYSIVKGIENRYGKLPPATTRHITVLEVKLFAKKLGISKIVSERQHVHLHWPITEALFERLMKFLPEGKSRAQCELLVEEERVVLRGLGVCTGDVQLAKVRRLVDCFTRASANFTSHDPNAGKPSLAQVMSKLDQSEEHSSKRRI